MPKKHVLAHYHIFCEKGQELVYRLVLSTKRFDDLYDKKPRFFNKLLVDNNKEIVYNHFGCIYNK